MEPEKKEQTFTLVKKQQVLQFSIPLTKVLGFAPMFNNTFVILGIKTLRYENVAHYDAEGKCLRELVFHDSNLYPFIVPSDRQIIWVDIDRDLLLQWNLQSYELLEFPFKYNNDTADSHEVFFFPKTKLICIGEWGRHDSDFLRFTYFKYPLRQNSEPVCVFERNDVWNYQYTIRRANTSSKFVWWKCAMVEEIELKVFELVQKDGNFEGKYTQHKCKNPFESVKGKTCELSVGCVWQMTPNKYLIVSITDRPHTQTEYPNALFVYEEDKKLFRQAKFAFEGKYRFQYIHYYNFGRTSMIRSFDFDQNQPLNTPIYYIDNIGEQIAAIDYWHCSHLNKFTVPGYDADVIIDAEYQNGDVSKIKSTTVKVKYDFPQKIPWSEYIVNLIDGIVNQDTIDLCEEAYNLFAQDLIAEYEKEYQMQVHRFKTEI